jgi:hypothetical protein
MNLCSDGHDEVCYEGRECPVCKLREEMQSDIDMHITEKKALQTEVDSLDSELSELQEIVDINNCTKLLVKRATDRMLKNDEKT